jgi:uncharacterized protein YbjT (DUF2867 family)
MRIAVAAATGNIGARIASFLERAGHDVIPISRSLGVGLITGRGLDAALRGVDAVVDATSSPPVRTKRDGVATIPPLLVQPIARDDIAQVLAEVATVEQRGRYVDVAGPEPQHLVDIARRTNDVLGRKVKLVPTCSGPLDESMAGNCCWAARTPVSPRRRSTSGWRLA